MEPTRLEDLPAFVVRRIVPGETPRLSGTFTHLRSVALGGSWLYERDDPLIGNLVELDSQTREAVFEAPFWTPASRIQVGTTAPWLEQHWQAWHVTAILDPQAGWNRVPFPATDAQVFERDGRTYLSQIHSGQVPEGATLIRVEPGGWDHDHCQFCMTGIGVGDDAYHADGPDYLGYDCWLCLDCGDRYAQTRSLAFVWTRDGA